MNFVPPLPHFRPILLVNRMQLVRRAGLTGSGELRNNGNAPVGQNLNSKILGKGNTMKLFANFAKNESGAVTVDWVVLTAAIVGIAIAVLTVISGGIGSAASGIDSQLTAAGTNSAISSAINP